MQCSNNLKQLGIAVHNFAGTYNSQLPPLTASTGSSVQPKFQGSILVVLLPFIEQQNLYNICITNPGNTWDGTGVPTGGFPRTQQIKTYICPSDFTVSSGWSSAQVGSWMASSYAANFRLFGTVRAGGNADAPQYNIGNIPDGTSNTIAFAEGYAACNGNSTGNLWTYPGIDWGWQWTPVIADTRVDGNAWQYPPQPQPTVANCNKVYPQAIHTGVTVVALADGSVRTVPNGISTTTWGLAILPDDGQVLGSDW